MREQFEFLKKLKLNEFYFIKRSDSGTSTQKDNNEFISKVINSLKSEYLEKQKLAFNEIYQK